MLVAKIFSVVGRKLSWVVWILFFSTTSVCAQKGIYGPEFTFYVGGDGKAKPDIEAQMVVNQLKVRCSSCRFIESSDEGSTFVYVSPSGYKLPFTISSDPAVIEMQTSPRSSEAWSQIADDFQREVFGYIGSMGFKPDTWNGAGHLNLGLKSFRSFQHLKNFLSFYFSHPELALSLGEPSYDFAFAKHLLDMDEISIQAVAKLLQADPPAKFRSESQKLNWLLKSLDKIYEQRIDYEKWDILETETHSQALKKKFTSIRARDLDFPDQARLEIRAVRPQSSMAAWVDLTKLFDLILEHTSKGEIKFVVPHEDLRRPKEFLTRFHQLVGDIGAKPEDYFSLIRKSHRKIWRSLGATHGTKACRVVQRVGS